MAVRKTKSGGWEITRGGLKLANHRSAVQARDFSEALRSAHEMKAQQVSLKKPLTMIDELEIIGPDRLTAKDLALFDLFFANAMADGVNREVHEIAFSALGEYLGVDHRKRITSALIRLASTKVRYHGREARAGHSRAAPMILIDIGTCTTFGASVVTYALTSEVREVVAAARQYAHVELAVLPRFTGKYTSRIYQKLSALAGRDARFNRPWTISPQALAASIGYQDPNRASAFLSQVLSPAIAEINQHNSRFKVDSPQIRRSRSRGRPIESITIRVSIADRRVEQQLRADLTRQEANAIRRPDFAHARRELPSVSAVARSVARHAVGPNVLNNGWRSMLDRAKADPAVVIWGGRRGAEILDDIQYGVEPVFDAWSDALAAGEAEYRPRVPQRIDRTPHNFEEIMALRKDRSEKGRSAFRWALMRNEASQILDMLDGWVPGTDQRKTWDDDQFRSYFDHDMTMFGNLAFDLGSRFGQLRFALDIARDFNSRRMRGTLKTFATAIIDRDVGKVIRTAIAILAARKGSNVQAEAKEQEPSRHER
jgi:hypothetical protein